TLVELLVVISIIAILSVIGITVFSGVQKGARSAKRIADMKAIALSLEIYYNDPVNNFTYPNPGGSWRSECAGWGGHASDEVIPGLVPKYMASFPHDPGMNKSAGTSCYLYYSNGKDYALLDYKITELSSSDYLSYKTFVDPRRDGGSDNCVVDGTAIFAWKVSSGGGKMFLALW
ncbi:MAG: type II secretion system protein, partial [Candidatus Daviesbacteria bacterium]|nr:type II secretion system protein [Candidatus Daviesbacteria bacterium]